jgi:hypothetical protein
MPVPPVISTVPVADVAGLAEVPQCGGTTAHVPRRDRQRRQDARIEQGGEFDDELVHAGAAGFEEVERAIRHAGVFGGDGVGVADVGLAHLEEHPAVRHQPQRRVDEFACQRVEHDVEAAAPGDGEELLLEVERA